MPDESEEKLSAEDREALSAGRLMLWVKKNWQFLALAGFIGGPNAVKMATGMMVQEQAAQPSSYVERLAVVETKLGTVEKSLSEVNGKLDRLLSRRGASSEPEYGGRTLIESGAVSSLMLSRTAQP
jgi:hypothetical protein